MSVQFRTSTRGKPPVKGDFALEMTSQQAEQIFKSERANISRFLEYLNDVGVQHNLLAAFMVATEDSLELAKFTFSIFEGTLADVRRSSDKEWWRGAPSLSLLVDLVAGAALSNEPMVIIPSSVVPSEETVRACLVLFHEDKGYEVAPVTFVGTDD